MSPDQPQPPQPAGAQGEPHSHTDHEWARILNGTGYCARCDADGLTGRWAQPPAPPSADAGTYTRDELVKLLLQFPVTFGGELNPWLMLGEIAAELDRRQMALRHLRSEAEVAQRQHAAEAAARDAELEWERNARAATEMSCIERMDQAAWELALSIARDEQHAAALAARDAEIARLREGLGIVRQSLLPDAEAYAGLISIIDDSLAAAPPAAPPADTDAPGREA